MQLQLCTWVEVETYLEHSRGILIPIGSTEQHGPNGLLGTDAICPEVVCHGVGEALGVLVGPTLPVGMAQHHLAFPGTLSLRPSTLLAVVRDVVASLARHGFSRVYFLNGHGGNMATISAAFSELYAELSLKTAPESTPPRCRLRNWWSGKRVQAASRRLFGAADGTHATASEVSLSYYARPGAVKEVEMTPKVAPDGPIHDAADFRRRFPDGRMGSDPSLATVEAGETLYRAAVDDVADDFRRFVGSG
jgi:creatinine amidohydrolase